MLVTLTTSEQLLDKITGKQVMLLLIYCYVHFHIVSFLQAAAKVIMYMHTKKVKLQKLGVYGIYNPQALSSALTLLGHHSPVL